MSWLRKRLTTVFAAPALAWLTTFLTTKLGVSPDAAAELAMAILGVAGLYIAGQSWSDGKAIEKGTKEH